MPIASRRRLRKTLLWLAGTVALLLAIILTSPFWLGYALKPIASRYGATVRTVETAGYNGLVLNDVHYQKDSITFSAQRVETVQPIDWVWNRLRTGTNAIRYVTVSDWKLEITPSHTTNTPSPRPPSARETLQKLTTIGPRLQPWLTSGTLTNGTVHFGTNNIQIPTATWTNGLLSGVATANDFPASLHVDLNLTQSNYFGVRVAAPELEAEARLNGTNTTDAFVINGDVRWRTNAANVGLQFGPEGTRPQRAQIQTTSVMIPSAKLHLTNYNDVLASFIGDWDGTNFTIRGSATAQSTVGQQPLHAEFAAHGTTNAIRIESFHLTSAWATAELSKNVDVSFTGRLLSEVAEFKLDADLSQQPFVAATGLVSGQVSLRRSPRRYPDAQFKVTAHELGVSDIHLTETDAAGHFAWPNITFDHLFGHFAEGATATAQGTLNLADKTITNSLVEIAGTLPKAFQPTNVTLGTIHASAKINGPFRNLSHEGKIQIAQIIHPAFNPLSLSADWKGIRADLKQFSADLAVTNASFHIGGAASIATNQSTLSITSLTLITNKINALTLLQPTSISVTKEHGQWHGSIEPFHLTGPAGELTIDGETMWPSKGNLTISAQHIHAPFIQHFVRQRIQDVAIDHLHLSGGWTNAPITFSLNTTASYDAPDIFPVQIRINAVGNKTGMRFDQLDVSTGKEHLLAAVGTLPLRIDPSARGKMVQLEFNEPIDFHASTKATANFWNRFTNVLKVVVTDPSIKLDVSGTLKKPQANLSARMTEAQWLGAKRPLPRLTDVTAQLTADRAALHLKPLQFKIEGQPVLFEADLPLGDLSRNWKEALNWKNAHGRFVINNAQVAPFTKYLPPILGPSGTVDLNVTVEPGPRVNGDLRILDVETKPLGTIGAVHDLRARLKFTESVIQITNVTGVLGGEPVGLSGFVDIAHTATNKIPLFNLRLVGLNVPLTRRPDLILRADLQLNAINTPTNDQPVVNGTVAFNNSFFLGDLKMLLPGKVTKPSERPPYFSVEAEPFDRWKLNVRLIGDDFMKIRTPLFRGSLSANWHLRGTLREPIAVGDAKINSGQVQFPFSNLRVQQGFITLSSEDPFRPQIFAMAGARTFGYDVQMTLNGPADKPVIEFSSTPPLTSEQVLLMITAGEVPKREATFTTQERASKLAVFLGRSILSKFSSDEGGAERLTVTSGEYVTDQGKQTYSLEYKITDDVSIIGEYDRFGAWNAGVKWRVYAK